MFRFALAAALLAALPLMPLPASAQQAPFVTVECSQNITGIGRRAAVFERAVDSAIDAYDAEARRIHGAQTNFTYRGGEALNRGGRLSLSCTRRAGLHSCEARGRSCAWVQTRTPNTEVASRCRDGYRNLGAPGDDLVVCRQVRHNERSGPLLIEPPPGWGVPTCPRGYSLDETNPGRCLRG